MTSSESFSCCWGLTKSASRSQSSQLSVFSPLLFMRCEWYSALFSAQTPTLGKLPDLTPREAVMMGVMIVGLLWLGFFPQPVLDTFRPALDNLQGNAQMSVALLRR